MARDAFSRVPIPSENIHPIPTSVSPHKLPPVTTTLKRFYGADMLAPDRPLFDVTLGIERTGTLVTVSRTAGIAREAALSSRSSAQNRRHA
jgi:hypothetical protein